MKIQERLSKLGRRTGVLLVFGLLIAGVASGTLLTHFGTIATTIEVNRAVMLEGTGCDGNICSESLNAAAGETITTSEYTATSQTSVDIPIEIATTVNLNDGGVEATKAEYKLEATGVQGTEARIHIKASDLGITTLADLITISFEQYVSAGYIGHVDVLVDTDGDGEKDDALVFEYDKEQAPSDQTVENMAYTRDTWVDTFNDKGTIDSTSKAWLSSGAPGPVGGGGFIYGTLAEWKTGNVDASIDSDTVVTALEFEVDNWILDSTVKIRNIHVNSNPANVITVQTEKNIVFDIAVKFANGAEGSYDLNTEIQVQ